MCDDVTDTFLAFDDRGKQVVVFVRREGKGVAFTTDQGEPLHRFSKGLFCDIANGRFVMGATGKW